tara:strand:- start:381 stop:572 length:192 start_codon:yes stop_codon:yes gene_type:complete
MVSGPTTTTSEFEYLKSLNQTQLKEVKAAGCCMDDKLMSIMQKGAFRMLYFDNTPGKDTFDSI